jgi:glycine/D-amino acid oxidase-like deaminating enzyme
MTRIFPDYAYGSGPRAGCWWDETIASPDWPELHDDVKADVVIVGAGFTGMSAALHLAEMGTQVVVLEAKSLGWGASGRNGGFCCLGGSRLDQQKLIQRFGKPAANEYAQVEKDAVNLVASLLERLGINADRHSHGETQLAHRPRDMETLRKKAEAAALEGGNAPELIEQKDLPAHGMNGPFYGALTTSVGFGLNPRKYLFGMAAAAVSAGMIAFQKSPVTKIIKQGSEFIVQTAKGRVRCSQVVIATNGYSSEDLPDWLAGRYMPSQSNVLVTRPMTERELQAQGWTSDQMAYDTRNLLHYFRLMPDRRFLFGMRGGLTSSATSEQAARRRTRQDFDRMFPAWQNVESPHSWSGMVCLARNLTPFVGPVPGNPGMFAGLAYHGNGVAMGSYCGRLLAGLASGSGQFGPVPKVMQTPLARFPFGRARRILMAPAYASFGLRDR